MKLEPRALSIGSKKTASSISSKQKGLPTDEILSTEGFSLPQQKSSFSRLTSNTMICKNRFSRSFIESLPYLGVDIVSDSSSIAKP